MKNPLIRSLLAASLIGLFGVQAFAGQSMPMISGGGAGPGVELHLPPPLPTAAAAPNSGAWVRPYVQGDGGVGAMGGYTSPGGTSVHGNIYVPNVGTPSGGASIETHF
jgi:hypothetical protein